MIRSPGFSRIGRSRQDAAVPTGIHRLMNFEHEIQISLDRSPGFSRIGRSLKWRLFRGIALECGQGDWQRLPLQCSISRIGTGCGRAEARPYHKKSTLERIGRSLQYAAVPAGIHRLIPMCRQTCKKTSQATQRVQPGTGRRPAITPTIQPFVFLRGLRGLRGWSNCCRLDVRLV
jgi:hypothetical protein